MPGASAQCLTEEAYFRFKRERGAISQSDLKAFVDDPEGWALGKRITTSKDMRWGSLVDCLLLYPEQFAELYAVHDFAREDKRVKAYAAWLAGIGDREPLKLSALRDAGKVLRGITQSRVLMDILFPAFTEPPAAALETLPIDADGNPSPLLSALIESRDFAPQIAVACSVVDATFAAKLDIVPDTEGPWSDWLFDLKVTSFFSGAMYCKKAADLRAHWQGASYLDAYNAATGDSRTRFAHIVCEAGAPYRSVFLPVSESAIETGRSEYQDALAYFLHCRAARVYPGPFAETEELELPHWYRPFERPAGVPALGER